jgi:SAM-dependent methyltransferase
LISIKRILFFLTFVVGLPASIKNKGYLRVVDLGSGSNPRNPFQAKSVVGVDLSLDSPFTEVEGLSYKQIGDRGRLPFGDQSLDGITAFDVIEHLPRQTERGDDNLFIGIMNEIYRTLKPGGVFLAVTPSYPSPAAFLDPTHVNIITSKTHKYFSDDVYAKSLNYGFAGEFRTLAVGWYPWVGSWVDESKFLDKVRDASPFISATRRFVSLGVFYALFPLKRTHFMWVLERV